MRAPGVRVHRTQAEKIRRYLASRGLLADLKIKKDGDFVLIPIKEEIPEFEIVYEDFEEYSRPEGKVGSYDIVGDIAVIKYREGRDIERIIRALEKRKNIRKIAVDYGVVGEERIRKLELIKGDSLETVHREYGIKLKVDISKVYFSPRLATERWRVVQRVRDGETIFDMFAGCGPFSIMIAKYRRVKIHACDINPHAIEYLRENIKLNRVEGIEIHLGDARDVAEKIRNVDRVIMNLPHSSYHFLPHALKTLRKGGEIHYYEILPRNNAREEDLVKLAEDMGYRIKILEKRMVHAYSPGMDMYSFLLQVI